MGDRGAGHQDGRDGGGAGHRGVRGSFFDGLSLKCCEVRRWRRTTGRQTGALECQETSLEWK